MNIEERIFQLKNEQKAASEKFAQKLIDLENEVRANVPTALTPGKWYTSGRGLLIYGGDMDNCTGFWDRVWDNDWTLEVNNKDPIRPATESEVESALISEAKKRGFEEGVSFRALNDCGDKVTTSDYSRLFPGHNKWRYDGGDCDCFGPTGHGWIYMRGQWAEIVKDEVRIAGEKVEYHTHVITTGAKTYSREQLNQTVATLGLPNVTGIEVTKCNGEKVIVTASEIQKILDRWK